MAHQRNTPGLPRAAVGVDVVERPQRSTEAVEAGDCCVDVAVADLAGRQDGVVGRGQLAALGMTPGQVRHRLRTGRLHRVFRGVYAVGHEAIGDLGRVRAALMAAGPTAVASHRTAAELHRLTPVMPRQVEVTVTRAGPRSRGGLTIHRTTRPPTITTARGLPVTAPSRTLADLAAELSADAFESLCAEALVRHLVSARDLDALAPDAAPTRSELERRFRRLVRDAGLPPPEVNPQHGATLPDFRWPGERVIVETDGWAAHQGRAAFERDRARDADRTGDGWAVLRFTARQVDDRPAWVVARLAATLSTSGRARCAPAAAPRG